MEYLEVALGWCIINLFMIFIVFVSHYPFNYFLTYFFVGYFFILLFGVIETIKKDRERNKAKDEI